MPKFGGILPMLRYLSAGAARFPYRIFYRLNGHEKKGTEP